MKTYKLLLTLGAAIFALSYSLHAQADNDDLAFEFISAEPNAMYSVDECQDLGVYTATMATLVKANKGLSKFDIRDFYETKDFCQQVYEELYPRQYDVNARIRRIVK